jgi:hypothetical protein
MTDIVEVTTQRALPAGVVSSVYSASEIILYGVDLISLSAFGGLVSDPISISILAYGNTVPPIFPSIYSCALVYGYAYQGHCYSLPEPVVVVVEKAKSKPAKGCGFDPALGYKMWTVDKLQKTVLLEATNDTFEETVLKKNIVGSRQPVSYHSAAQIAHRGGKLVE